MRVAVVFFLSTSLAAYIGSSDGSGYCEAFAPIITPRQFSSPRSRLQLHAEQPNSALLSDLKALQAKESTKKVSSSDYFVADAYNDETSEGSMAAMAEELKDINSGGKLMAASAEITPQKKLIPKPPPLVFDPSNPKAMIAIAKAFIAADFGIQTTSEIDISSPTNSNMDIEKATAVPSYSSSLLSDTNFIWVSGNNINDGRTGILNKKEYLTAGHYFDLRSSFPDLEYRAHDFRVLVDEKKEYYGSDDGDDESDGEVTVRFTTWVTGTFIGGPLKLRSKVIEPNGEVMNCPPTSVSITFATNGSEKGKIIKLVTDMVMDRQIGNTHGYSGIAGAAVIAGEEPNDFLSQPPLVVLGRKFTGELPYFDEHYGEEHFPPFPDTVMIQLAKDVVESNFGLDKPDLLSDKFSYVEPSMGPLNKIRYLEKFTAYGILDAVKDMDYGIMNYRVDPYNPYRIWVDQRSKGTRTGAIGNFITKFPMSTYESAPEAMSFSFDDDGYCTRITAAAVLDPLLGNSGGLGGMNGLLYATGTPKTALMTRSLSSFFTRATKSLFSKVGLSLGADSFKTSDGKVVKRLLPFGKNGLPSTVMTPRSHAKPYFAAPVIDKSSLQINDVPPATTKQVQIAQFIEEPKPLKSLTEEKVSIDANPKSSDVGGIADAQIIASATSSESASIIKAKELRDKASQARIEAAEAEAMERAIALKVKLEEEKKKALELKLEEEQRRLQLIEEAKKTLVEEAKMMKEKVTVKSTKKKDNHKGSNDDPSTRFPLLNSLSLSRDTLKGKKTPPKATSPPPKRSPTLNLFNTSAGHSNSPSAKKLAKTKYPTPKRSPTLNIFSSASKLSSPKVSSSTGRVKKPSSTTPSSRSPTLSIMGVGGAPKSNAVKAASKKKSVAKKSSGKKKTAAVKPSPAHQSPTISLLGIGASPDSKAAVKKSSAGKAPASKSPTLSLFGVGGKAASKDSFKAKAPAKKSPTISLFGVAGPTQSASSENKRLKSTSTVKKRPSSTFSLFDVANQGATKAATKTTSIAPKTLSKPHQAVPKNKEATNTKAALKSNTFGGFFGSSDSGNTKEHSSTEKKKKSVVKKAPKGVPVLKGWKVNASKEIQGRVYSSTSFKSGEMITTSPVKGHLQSGTVVISKSGSKYYLE